MKAVILAGGLGTRLAEETTIKPKPMVEIGGKPILWHIMKTYSHYGVNEFIICLGYKGYVIKEYFANYFLHMSDVTFDMVNNTVQVHQQSAEPWQVTLVDTGDATATGGRLKRIRSYVENDDFFFMTYGDGVADIRIDELLRFHQGHGGYATVTATTPPGRFGVLSLEDDLVQTFSEKPSGDGGVINGGYFVLSPTVFKYIHDDTTIWEKEPLEQLALEGQLRAFKHKGFWQPMDTLRDKLWLESLWDSAKAPWRVW